MASLLARIEGASPPRLAREETAFLDLVDLVDLHHTSQVCKARRVLPQAHLGLQDPLAPLHLDKDCRCPSEVLLTEETVLFHPSCFLVSLVSLLWDRCLLARPHLDMGLPQAPLHCSRVCPLRDPSLPVHLGH